MVVLRNIDPLPATEVGPPLPSVLNTANISGEGTDMKAIFMMVSGSVFENMQSRWLSETQDRRDREQHRRERELERRQDELNRRSDKADFEKQMAEMLKAFSPPSNSGFFSAWFLDLLTCIF